jgi:predicted ArsR family transcriptional regulator
LLFTFEKRGDPIEWLQLIGEEVEEFTSKELELKEKIIAYLKDHPWISIRSIAGALKMNRDALRQKLELMETAKVLVRRSGSRNAIEWAINSDQEKESGSSGS